MLVLSKGALGRQERARARRRRQPGRAVLANSRLGADRDPRRRRRGALRRRGPQARERGVGAALRRSDLRRRDRSPRSAIPRAKEVAPPETQQDRELLHAPSIVIAGSAMGFDARRRRLHDLLRGVRAQEAGRADVGVRARARRQRGRQRDRHASSRRSCAARSARSGSSRARWSRPRSRCSSRRGPTAGSRSCSRRRRRRARGARARLAFDSLLAARRCRRGSRARVRRYETRFQIVWVLGGLARGALLRWRRPGSSSSRSSCSSAGSRTSVRSGASGPRRRAPRRHDAKSRSSETPAEPVAPAETEGPWRSRSAPSHPTRSTT